MCLEVIDMAGAGCEEEKIGEAQPSSARLQRAVEVFSTRNPSQVIGYSCLKVRFDTILTSEVATLGKISKCSKSLGRGLSHEEHANYSSLGYAKDLLILTHLTCFKDFGQFAHDLDM